MTRISNLKFRISGFIPLLACALLAFTAGCAAPGLNSARENFYMGKPDNAITNLAKLPDKNTQKILPLMERGTIYQFQGNYTDSSRDWMNAVEIGEELDYYSLSQGGASLVINDRMKAFRGAPYERTLLRAFNAMNYFAMALWDDAAVEARHISDRLTDLNGFPDDPYSRYVAGVAFQLINDEDGASRQFKKAAELLKYPAISETGHLTATNLVVAGTGKNPDMKADLICFIGIGRSPTEYGTWAGNTRWGACPYAEVYAGEKYLGRSYAFNSTQALVAETGKRLAALRLAKDVTRIVVKEAASHAVSEKNPLLGELLRVILFSLESPDTRRWETLPMWLQVARVPCPANLSDYTLVFRGAGGNVVKKQTITAPLTRRRKTYVSFHREL